MKTKTLKFVPQVVLDGLLEKYGRGAQERLSEHFGMSRSLVSNLIKNPDAYIGSTEKAQDYRMQFCTRLKEMLFLREIEHKGYEAFEKGEDCPYADGSERAVAWTKGFTEAKSDARRYENLIEA